MDSLYAFIDWLALQIIPNPQTSPEMLMRSAQFWLSQPRRDASYAAGEVSMKGRVGKIIPANTLLARADGALYSVVADTLIDASPVLVGVRAVVAGAAGNCDDGIGLTLQASAAGINAKATVSGGLAGGADIESYDSVLGRIYRRVQTPPRAGCPDDYVSWMFDASPAVTGAWCYPRGNGPGTVVCRFRVDAHAGGIPSPADVAQVESYITAIAPGPAVISVLAPVASPLHVEIQGLDPTSSTLQAAIRASLIDLIRREASPGGTYGVGPQLIAGGKLLRSHIEEAIASVPGVNDFTLITPDADIQVGVGHMTTMGSITWS
jgi:uncharacterized phage protein gp47/JayE